MVEHLATYWLMYGAIYVIITMFIMGLNGVRDGMEGIADLFICFFWPLIVLFFTITLPYWMGKYLMACIENKNGAEDGV